MLPGEAGCPHPGMLLEQILLPLDEIVPAMAYICTHSFVNNANADAYIQISGYGHDMTALIMRFSQKVAAYYQKVWFTDFQELLKKELGHI